MLAPVATATGDASVSIIDDFNTAVAQYPVDNVDLEFVEVDFDGDALNKSEVATFRVKVTNRGLLNLTGVKLEIKGQNGAKIGQDLNPTPTAVLGTVFHDDITTDALDPIPANGGSVTTGGNPLKMKAPNTPLDPKTLMRATLKEWDVNLDSLLVDNTRALDDPKASFVHAVVDE
jgi:hypothetical protein